MPGRQVRLQMPYTIDKALNMAIVATNADREDRASREDRGANRQVFAVRGNREDTPFGRRDKPQEKFQWSGNRGDYSHSGVGHNTRGRGVDGTRSRWTDSRTPMGWTTEPSVGGGAASGPKSGDDRYAPRPQGIQCYNCGQMGHTRRGCSRGQQRN